MGDAEIERRKHVEAAIANSRIEGMPPPDGAERLARARKMVSAFFSQ
jgi:hypothetical protein